MAGKKKKKPAANPARGFATVSLPSKTKVVDDVDDIEESNPKAIDSTHARSTNNNDGLDKTAQLSVNGTDTNSMTSEQYEAHLEKVWYENIAITNAARVKSDAARQVAKLQNEWRLLRLNADNAIIPELNEEVLNQILKDAASIDQSTRLDTTDMKEDAQSNEQDHLLSLWVLYNVLVSLKMPVIDDVLASIAPQLLNHTLAQDEYVTGLTACFEWYAANIAPEELPNYQSGKVAELHVEEEIEEDDTGKPFPPQLTPCLMPPICNDITLAPPCIRSFLVCLTG